MEKRPIINGKIIFCQVLGAGKPVVLLHGFAEDHRCWENQVNALTGNYQLIVPDLPGSGSSEPTDDMSMEGMADTVYQLLLTEISPSVLAGGIIILGHSMGGYITLAFSEKYPEITTGFGLVHSTAYADTDEKKIARQRGIEFIRNHGSYEFLKQTIPNLFGEQYRISNESVVAAMIEQYRYFDPVSLITYYEKMMQRPDKTGWLRVTNKPVLFIAGEHDLAIPCQHSLQQCHLPQLSYIHILKNSGHMGMWEERKKTNEVLANFIEDLL